MAGRPFAIEHFILEQLQQHAAQAPIIPISVLAGLYAEDTRRPHTRHLEFSFRRAALSLEARHLVERFVYLLPTDWELTGPGLVPAGLDDPRLKPIAISKRWMTCVARPGTEMTPHANYMVNDLNDTTKPTWRRRRGDGRLASSCSVR